MSASRNFAIIGVAGFVAPRHLAAIHAVGGNLTAATDPHDAVGVLDRYSFDVRFFSEIERFDRHLDKLRRGPAAQHLHYVSICSPNYLHDAHIRLALRSRADAICEKPLVVNPWNLDPLEELERETGRRVHAVLQLRLHDGLRAIKARIDSDPARRHRVSLAYVTPRGAWYSVAWKGQTERSGGLLVNIGIHLFDMLLWLFGPAEAWAIHAQEPTRCTGSLRLARADVVWLLSTRREDLPDQTAAVIPSYRQMVIDGEATEFSEGFTSLHTRVYEEILAGRGFGIADARPSIELVHALRSTPVTPAGNPLAHAL